MQLKSQLLKKQENQGLWGYGNNLTLSIIMARAAEDTAPWRVGHHDVEREKVSVVTCMDWERGLFERFRKPHRKVEKKSN